MKKEHHCKGKATQQIDIPLPAADWGMPLHNGPDKQKSGRRTHRVCNQVIHIRCPVGQGL